MGLRFRGRDIRPTQTGPRVNQDIRAREVRVIDDEGEQLGVLSVPDAIQAAQDRDLDLVEVAPNSEPPVCKIMDFGRYKYSLQKKAQEAKKRQKVVELKEVKMRIKIEDHDYLIKKKNAERFLLDGNKAKVTIMFRGREVTHPDFGRRLLAEGIRAHGDFRNEKIGYKIREAQMEKIPYMLVVGAREAEAGQVSLRVRGAGDAGALPAEEAIRRIRADIEGRALAPGKA